MTLEALAAGNCVFVNDRAPNVETVGETGLTFSGSESVASPTARLERVLADPELEAAYRERAREHAGRFSWDALTDQYEQLLLRARDASKPGPLPPEFVARPGQPAALH